MAAAVHQNDDQHDERSLNRNQVCDRRNRMVAVDRTVEEGTKSFQSLLVVVEGKKDRTVHGHGRSGGRGSLRRPAGETGASHGRSTTPSVVVVAERRRSLSLVEGSLVFLHFLRLRLGDDDDDDRAGDGDGQMGIPLLG